MIIFSLGVIVPSALRNEVVHTVGALLGPTRAMPGCLECRLYADCEDRNAFMLVEEWESQDALNRHLNSDAYKTLVSTIELSTQPPHIHFDTVIARSGLEVIREARESSRSS